MDQKTKTYLWIGGATLLIILIVVGAATYFQVGDPLTLGAGLSAMSLAAAASQRRVEASQVVEQAAVEAKSTAQIATDTHDQAITAMDAVTEEIKKETRDQKAASGEKLFG